METKKEIVGKITQKFNQEIDVLENQLETNLINACRRNTRCIACGKEKDSGIIVCWSCFKYRKDNFKNSDLSLIKWLEKIGKI